MIRKFFSQIFTPSLPIIKSCLIAITAIGLIQFIPIFPPTLNRSGGGHKPIRDLISPASFTIGQHFNFPKKFCSLGLTQK